ncbi:hypothetical protein [Chryseobacterium sp. HSC-36S06]|uniref:hypothetical protein n=1 Tax=Chryseobacterium sp. HSC-36S06 TaxID=2910970 RepID=UPI00209CAEA2|nr:hypothetical protein [Chryseobacterium sp. HSC-36S06]MCP2039099.1 hypothetical protein [Chryseobacterium sp. HSC-36S06]
MKKDLLISKNVLFPVAVFGLIFTVCTITFDLTPFGLPLEAGKILTYTAVLCNFVTVIVLIVDVFKNNLSTKYLWTLGFLFSGCIAGVYYLLKRDSYLSKA